MIIQHNITAMNSHRQLSGNNSTLGKNLEKLSSGFRINRAGDDAAGLSISEKMRAQIKGLETATKNAKDGISLIQTAEGALTEVHSMIDRMATLATQSANGTYNSDQRSYMQDELNKLLEDIDRISEGTNFNGTKLLDGTLGGGAGKSGIPRIEKAVKADGTEQNLTITAATKASKEMGTAFVNATGAGEVTVTYQTKNGNETVSKDVKISFDASTTKEDIAKKVMDNEELKDHFDMKVNGDKITFTAKEAGSKATYVTTVASTGGAAGALTGGTAGTDEKVSFADALGAVGDSITIDGTTYELVKDGQDAKEGNVAVIATKDGGAYDANNALLNLKNALSDRGIEFVGTDITASNTSESFKYAAGKAGSGLSLQVGDKYDDANKIAVNIKSMSSAGLGIKGLDITNQKSAGEAIDKISKAKEGVSAARSAMGALQNRLEHVINNLGVATENMAESESRIRDVDMAHEMMAFTKNNILTQAAQSMLAQANQLPQGVLQLLR